MSEQKLLRLILLATFILGGIYTVIVPVFEGGDELWHYPMVRHLADGNPLPIQVFDPAEAGPWKQQASQPPLYYYIGAALTFWVDASDMEEKRWQNPHVDNGIVSADGNINLTIHNPNWSQWQGTLLAVRLVRLFGALLGVGTAYFTYRTAKFAFPDRSDIPLAATALVAFLPMRLFVGAAVNNDNLIIFLSTLALFLLVGLVAAPPEKPLRRLLLIGVVIGLAALTKIIGVGLIALAIGALFIHNWKVGREQELTQRRRRRGGNEIGESDSGLSPLAFGLYTKTVNHFLLLLLPVAAISGWWYVRNVQLYDDWRGWSAFIAVLGERPQPATIGQLWDERFGFMQAFWGLFGGVNIPMHGLIYSLLNWLTVIGVIGFAAFVVRETWRFGQLQKSNQTSGLNRLLAFIFNLATRHFALVAALVWTAAIVYGLISWATTTWSSQGRLVFGALSAESLLLTTGLLALLPKQVAKISATALGGFMFAIALLAPFIYIRPAYHATTYLPDYRPDDDRYVQAQPLDFNFDNKIKLIGATVYTEDIRPNAPFKLTLHWHPIAKIDQNYSVFVHLNDSIINNPIAQRDMYLGQGMLATSFMLYGDNVRADNYYELFIPPTTYAPAELKLNVGLYNVESGERLLLVNGGDSAEITTLLLNTPASGLPNPTNINFGNQLNLDGYELSNRRLNAGSTIDLNLTTRTLAQLDTDYSYTAQIIPEDLGDTTRYAASDLQQPTSQWLPDDQQTIPFTLTVDPNTPPGVYRLVLGVYTQQDGQFSNLHLVDGDRITNDTLLTLTKIRVDP